MARDKSFKRDGLVVTWALVSALRDRRRRCQKFRPSGVIRPMTSESLNQQLRGPSYRRCSNTSDFACCCDYPSVDCPLCLLNPVLYSWTALSIAFTDCAVHHPFHTAKISCLSRRSPVLADHPLGNCYQFIHTQHTDFTGI